MFCAWDKCSCKALVDGCKTKTCSCAANSLQCTKFCNCGVDGVKCAGSYESDETETNIEIDSEKEECCDD